MPIGRLFIATPLTVIALAIILFNASRIGDQTFAYLCGTMLGGVALFMGLRFLLARLLLSREDWSRHRLIQRSVKIKSFGSLSTTFLFRNQVCGSLFAEANKHPDPAEIEKLLNKPLF